MRIFVGSVHQRELIEVVILRFVIIDERVLVEVVTLMLAFVQSIYNLLL